MRRSLVLDINLAQSEDVSFQLMANCRFLRVKFIHICHITYQTKIKKERVRLHIKKRKPVSLKTNVSSHDQ